MKLTKQTQADILKHAQQAAPNESCGFVVLTGRKQTYHPCENVATLPQDTFEIPADAWIGLDGEIVAVVHSHPRNEPYLSAADRKSQHQSELPWALATSGEVKLFRFAPLLRGRVFAYGTADCFTLVRDAFMLCGIEFRDHPRTDMDADAAAGSFEQNLPDGGFIQVHDGLQAGDVVLTAQNGVANHAAVYLGNGEMLHHAYDQLSRVEPYSKYWQRVTHSVWRHKQWRPEMLEAIKNDIASLN